MYRAGYLAIYDLFHLTVVHLCRLLIFPIFSNLPAIASWLALSELGLGTVPYGSDGALGHVLGHYSGA